MSDPIPNMSAPGYVYFLFNLSMPGLLKIGYTHSEIHERIAELGTTGVPEPFHTGAIFYVCNPEECERKLHDLFEDCRKQKNREFFQIALDEAIKRAWPVVEAFLSGTTQSGDLRTKAIGLSFEESEVLVHLVHDDRNAPMESSEIARLHAINLQKVLLACGNLLHLGLIEEHRSGYGSSSYRLTHRGRKYCFEHDLVMQELLNEA